MTTNQEKFDYHFQKLTKLEEKEYQLKSRLNSVAFEIKHTEIILNKLKKETDNEQ